MTSCPACFENFEKNDVQLSCSFEKKMKKMIQSCPVCFRKNDAQQSLLTLNFEINDAELSNGAELSRFIIFFLIDAALSCLFSKF